MIETFPTNFRGSKFLKCSLSLPTMMTTRDFRIPIQHCCAYCALPTRHENPHSFISVFVTQSRFARMSEEAKIMSTLHNEILHGRCGSEPH